MYSFSKEELVGTNSLGGMTGKALGCALLLRIADNSWALKKKTATLYHVCCTLSGP